MENYILKSTVCGKPPEKGYFIFYILGVRVIGSKQAHKSSSNQCGRPNDNHDSRGDWLPRKVPRPQINSVHGSLSFRVATNLISINSPQIWIQIVGFKSSHFPTFNQRSQWRSISSIRYSFRTKGTIEGHYDLWLKGGKWELLKLIFESEVIDMKLSQP